MSPAPSWYTAAELADLALPGLPATKRKVNDLAAAKGWALARDLGGAPLARPRAGRGGGMEYSPALLPTEALLALGRGAAADPSAAPICPKTDGNLNRDAAWAVFERASAAKRAEAQRRLDAVARVEALAKSQSRTLAVAATAAEADCSTSTLWSWLDLVAGVPAADRLPHLLPQRRGGGKPAEVDPGAWAVLKSDYLRFSGPSFRESYDRVLRDYCAPRGIDLPHVKTMQRKLEREVDPRVIIAKRQGDEALRLTQPAQKRSVAAMTAMELVNIDGHRWDVFVRWPDGEIARPMMVAIQDVWSRKMLAWRIGRTESAELTRLAFADLFKRWGVPRACLMDNGRAFASKTITGGTANRYRFKVKPEDPLGLLGQLNVQVRWATPYHGQAKPIERAFRDLTAVARHPLCEGAYTGSNTDAKPENYGSKAVPLDVFERLVAAGIKAHNARPGRRTEAAAGRSFDAAWHEAYPTCGVGVAPEAVVRMALLAVDDRVRADKRDGSVQLHGNRYWDASLLAIAGERVMLRFDPEDLTAAVHVHRLDGTFVATAGLSEQAGFTDQAAARARAKQVGELRRATRRKAELEQLIDAGELARLMPLPEAAEPAPAPDRRVVRAIRGGAQRAPLIERFTDRLEADPAPAGPAKLRVVK